VCYALCAHQSSHTELNQLRAQLLVCFIFDVAMPHTYLRSRDERHSIGSPWAAQWSHAGVVAVFGRTVAGIRPTKLVPTLIQFCSSTGHVGRL